MKKLLTAISVIAVLAACNSSYQRAASGLVYKIFPSSSRQAGSRENFKIAYGLYTSCKKRLSNTKLYLPSLTYYPMDTAGKNSYDFREVLPKCKVGDSMIIIISVDSLKSKKLIPDYDNNFR